MVQNRKRLGDLLVDSGILTKEQVEETVKGKEKGQKLGDALLEKGLITEKQLIEVLEFQLGIPHVALNKYPVDSQIVSIVPKEFARRNLVFPIKRTGNKLQVAMADPMDYVAVDDLRMTTGFEIEVAIATKKDIQQAIYKYYELEPSMKEFSVEELEEDAINGSDLLDDSEDAPVVRMVNQLFVSGLQQQASDIHIDPQQKKILIRYRIDGVLKTEQALPKHFQNALTARIKIMANLNITETRMPQDGRVKVSFDEREVDLRISTMPTVFGEKIVVRVLDLSNTITEVSQLDFNKVSREKFKQLLNRNSGMVLITGPTGSGKTSTLYAALNYLNNEEINIITIEDPVEYQIEGINQVQVNPKIGLTFAEGLRSMLRQDPNIVMVGEIRDRDTAEIAVRASLTGHLVFSTLHTNSAIATIPRLIEMGIEAFLVMSSLSGIVAQRLVRTICPECKESYEPTKAEIETFTNRGMECRALYRGRGCNECNNTGYKGRIAIQEVLVIDDEIRKMVLNKEPMSQIKQYALSQDMIFLIDDGLFKAKLGHTTIEEVYRVAADD
ncbi:Flp pilus assembly complex ATPase component TadA [Bacillus shivajii]|uniref:GspE/PulE family protein n=1 Tax=Bacillus shivajii TaxID=1983719 RepID=UPI001CFA669F|nr:ATPase, T2SS/T4P/T4SS family [Bacillus shivajii]UCZ52100.1 Flp pilus assembly complex ATPase component TadA [Bacillus shivajii]